MVVRIPDRNAGVSSAVLAGVRGYVESQHLPWIVLDCHQQSFASSVQAPRAQRFVVSRRTSQAASDEYAIHYSPDRSDHPLAYQVWFDDVAIGRQAAEHLFAAGYRQAAVFVGMSSHPPYRLVRERSFIRAFTGLGGRCAELSVPRDRDFDAVMAWQRSQLLALPRPFACFAFQDLEAGWISSSVLRIGFTLDADIAIIGCEDSVAAINNDPPLTSVRVSWRLIGIEAARQIHRLVSGEPCARQILIQPQGVAVRASTRRAHGPFISRAEDLIRASLPRGLSVVRLARRLGISAVTLRRRFRDELGSEPRHAIRDQRLMAAQAMLADPSGPALAAIAKLGGWATTSHFIRDFRARFAITPGRFRSGAPVASPPPPPSPSPPSSPAA